MIILFAGTYCEPEYDLIEKEQGVYSIQGIFETVIEAREHLETLNKQFFAYDWAQIFIPLSDTKILEEKTVFFIFDMVSGNWITEEPELN